MPNLIHKDTWVTKAMLNCGKPILSQWHRCYKREIIYGISYTAKCTCVNSVN